MNELIELTEEEWFDTFKPLPNLIDPDASFSDGENGYMFETYGKELEFVKAQDPNRIWTYCDGDNGGTYIFQGMRVVNRIGYFISEQPVPDNTTIQIMVSEPDLTCDFCGDILDEELEHDPQCEGINQ